MQNTAAVMTKHTWSFFPLYFSTCHSYKIICTKAKIGLFFLFFLHRRNSDFKGYSQGGMAQWTSLTSLMTIRLKKDEASYKNSLLLALCCLNMRQIASGSCFHHLPFVLWKEEQLNLSGGVRSTRDNAQDFQKESLFFFKAGTSLS